jgi:hypothetical protein
MPPNFGGSRLAQVLISPIAAGSLIRLRPAVKALYSPPMKFALAILTFVLFAFFISWGVIEMLKGRPWLLLAALGVFFGTFIKFGCQSQ